MVAPRAGAWIETHGPGVACSHISSRPVRARGLKLHRVCDVELAGESRPVRARGLKPGGNPDIGSVGEVAPRAGAWIET